MERSVLAFWRVIVIKFVVLMKNEMSNPGPGFDCRQSDSREDSVAELVCRSESFPEHERVRRFARAVVSCDRVDLARVEGEIDVALIALRQRFRSATGRAGIRNGLAAKRAVKHELDVLGLEIVGLSGYQAETDRVEIGEWLAGRPGQLGMEQSLGHVLLLPVPPRAPWPCEQRALKPGARFCTGLSVEIEWEGKRRDRDVVS
jgi:hypothetical protein